jgi:CBS-domain-containing membrane protein
MEDQMQARDVMVQGVIAVGPDMPVLAAAHSMVSNGISALLVMDISAKLVGIVSEGDLIRRVETDTERRRSWWQDVFVSSDALAREFVKSHARRVADVMTRKVITASPETSLREIADLMEEHAIKRVPIVEDGKVVGIVSRANLLQALADCSDDSDWEESDRVLRQRVLDGIKDMPWASRPFTVAVTNGRADLRGYVFSQDEKAAVRVAAEATPGVREVTDELQVLRPHVASI